MSFSSQVSMAFFLKYLLNLCIFLISSSYSTYAQYPESELSATAPTSWTNNPSSCPSYYFPERSIFRSILSKPMEYPSFGFGFYCNGNCTSFILSIIVHSPAHETQSADVIWSLNRNHPVTENATLTFTPEGELILKDADGKSVWSTGPTGRSVLSLNLTRMGNLVLYDAENQTVWQSYDHPTDTLLYGQNLVEGQPLIASVSSVNWTEGAYSFYVASDRVIAHVASDPSVDYYDLHAFGDTTTTKGPYYLRFENGSIVYYDAQDKFTCVYSFPTTQYIQYMKLGSDGHLRVYHWVSSSLNNIISKEVADLFSKTLSDCNYPMVCGHYGICSHGICSCPGVIIGVDYFKPVLDEGQKTIGCLETTPVTCEFPKYQHFLDVNAASYLDLSDGISGVDIQGCKQACMNNCSCKVAFFTYSPNGEKGYCYLRNQVFWLVGVDKELGYNTFASIKVQLTPNVSYPPNNFRSPPQDAPTKRKRNVLGTKVLLLILLVTSLAFLILITFSYILFGVKSKVREKNESYKDLLPGMPTRFTYEEVKTATGNFCRKLGQGGFGSVYEGALTDGTKVAVKCLDGLGHVRRSFLAEVEILGKIHHVSLVRLIGFCTHKSNMFLVYEYLCNGSLDKWIFRKTEASLSWNTRKKIIHDTAKGLAYLHEECIDKILHLDIKPQMDGRFNCKLSDFGLSKLIGKDKSRVFTSMRGTPGYLAPEWLNSIITDKADVYSFRIVVLEILCGRRNVDFTQPEEDIHLLSLLEKKTEKHLSEVIDRHNEDMQLHKDEAMKMMKVAIWCVQSDFSKRPSMSKVLNHLDGATDIEPNLDLNQLLTSVPPFMMKRCNEDEPFFLNVLSPSVLSGPR